MPCGVRCIKSGFVLGVNSAGDLRTVGRTVWPCVVRTGFPEECSSPAPGREGVSRLEGLLSRAAKIQNNPQGIHSQGVLLCVRPGM